MEHLPFIGEHLQAFLKKRALRSFTTKYTGYRGEEEALRFLRQKGLRLVEKNWQTKIGEIDLIMTDHDTLVFVEVKSRVGITEGRTVFDNITFTKENKLEKLANSYLKKRFAYTKLPKSRIDLVGVIFSVTKNDTVESIQYLKGAL